MLAAIWLRWHVIENQRREVRRERMSEGFSWGQPLNSEKMDSME